MKQIRGEPLTQTKLRKKQVISNIQSEIELMKLRAESHEELYQAINKEMQELLEKKIEWSKRGANEKNVERRVCQQEIHSKERWENSNVKWIAKYESVFATFFVSKNPFVSDEQF